ncbi:bifunctional metallophosphatase/5'-nucleotidase [Paenibacillus dakarensis]|uniref:bifunctional metallophosphatase/5'-nucleotidase n=1 Tax=Paenibacillus dakarensis TaxID=1527293 RepID=UPI0006D53156|nr:bifunctional UDP-sugar hydrolase/5'-nucleotidase [Paenibacillus dakarensis]
MSQMVNDKLIILHTNDIHSHFEMMSANAAVISRERKAAGEQAVLALDIGDHMDRAAVETEGTMGQANVDVINLTGYDAITIGNNEGLTVPPSALEAAYAGLLCPVVCCNLYELDSGKPPAWMKEHIIIEKNGIKIGITGATAPFSQFYTLLGWNSRDPETSIAQQVQLLRDQVDVLIVMSHLGIIADKILAERIPGIDIILGGHTHHLLEEPLFIEGTAVCGAGKFGNYVGKVIVEWKPDEGRYAVTGGSCIPVSGEELDPEVERAVLIHRQQAEEHLKEAVAITDRKLEIHYDQESSFANLLAQAVRHYASSDISIVNSGQLLGSLPDGEISAGMIHSLCPSPINPCVIKLSGADILQALEESLLPEYYDKKIFGYGFRGKVLGGLAVDGMEVLYNNEGSSYHKIIQASVQGIPIEREREYRVGTLDMFTFKVGYESLAKGKDIVFMLPEFLRDLLRQELSRPGALEQSFLHRFVPLI